MEIIGKVLQFGTLTEGNSPRGPWKKQELILETVETYPKKVCMICWNERVNEANGFFVGQIVNAQVSVESREFNGKWYTDVRVIRFEMQGQPAAQQQGISQQPQQPMQQSMAQSQNSFGNQAPLPPVNEAYFASSDNGDDLPF